MTTHYKQNGQYTHYLDKVHALMQDNFINPNDNPDIYLDLVDDMVINNYMNKEEEDGSQQ